MGAVWRDKASARPAIPGGRNRSCWRLLRVRLSLARRAKTKETRMKRISFAYAVLVGLAVGAAGALPAIAQRDRAPPTANQIADEVDARIAKLKAELRLTEDQSKNWGSVQTALHDIGVGRGSRYRLRDQPADTSRDPNAPRDAAMPRDPNAVRDANPPRDADDRERARTPDEIDRMRKEADYLTDRAAELRKLADATGPLYGSLDEGQRRRFVQYLRSERDEEREMLRDERRRTH
ncbi:MAG: hypothetical protein NVSMB26_08610 [Beijerinckiaceae bacterium]